MPCLLHVCHSIPIPCKHAQLLIIQVCCHLVPSYWLWNTDFLTHWQIVLCVFTWTYRHARSRKAHLCLVLLVLPLKCHVEQALATLKIRITVDSSFSCFISLVAVLIPLWEILSILTIALCLWVIPKYMKYCKLTKFRRWETLAGPGETRFAVIKLWPNNWFFISWRLYSAGRHCVLHRNSYIWNGFQIWPAINFGWLLKTGENSEIKWLQKFVDSQ